MSSPVLRQVCRCIRREYRVVELGVSRLVTPPMLSDMHCLLRFRPWDRLPHAWRGRAVSETDIAHGTVLPGLVQQVRRLLSRSPPLSAYAPAMPCPVLTTHMVLPGPARCSVGAGDWVMVEQVRAAIMIGLRALRKARH
eukprot:1273613-Rhodomonas_salina.1